MRCSANIYIYIHWGHLEASEKHLEKSGAFWRHLGNTWEATKEKPRKHLETPRRQPGEPKMHLGDSQDTPGRRPIVSQRRPIVSHSSVPEIPGEAQEPRRNLEVNCPKNIVLQQLNTAVDFCVDGSGLTLAKSTTCAKQFTTQEEQLCRRQITWEAGRGSLGILS